MDQNISLHKPPRQQYQIWKAVILDTKKCLLRKVPALTYQEGKAVVDLGILHRNPS